MVKKNGLPRQEVILLKFTVVSSFEEWSVLEVDAGQTFLEGYTFSPGYTLFSVEGMAQLSEWSRFNNQGQDFPSAYSFSLGCTMISVGRMA